MRLIGLTTLVELIREMPLYYPFWQKVPAERKAAILTKIMTQFDLKRHMQSQRWTDNHAGNQPSIAKLYNTTRQGCPENITADRGAQLAFWIDPGT
ncbi:hypothetical protein Tco_0195548 [Tanacetum coccineum]